MSVVVPASGAPASGLTCGTWATAADLPEAASALPVDTVALCLQAATDVLFALSGQRYPGVCTDVVRPCAKPVWRDHGRGIRQGPSWAASGGWTVGGAASAWGWCTCDTTERSGCYPVPEVPLPGYPVVSADVVKVDGVVLTAGIDYRVDDRRYLVRLPDPATGAERAWPCCQRLTLPDTAPGTFSVAYSFGQAPPRSGVLAGAFLAYQLALAVTPAAAGECKLPQRVTSLTRQGVTAVVLDPMAFLEKGRTGMYIVDLFLVEANRNGILRPATAWHPDLGGRSARRTG